VKFTATGEIRLAVRFVKEGSTNFLEFDVCDTGIGISPDQIGRLFLAFSQADESMTRRFGGTGLGLAISTRMAALLGGNVKVKSEPGKGSIFTLRIDVGPLKDVEMVAGMTESILPKPTFPDAQVWMVRGRILLVEDGLDNQRLISTHLRKAGGQVDIADNGRIGVDMALAAEAAARPYDLIVMDMQMPVLDGYGATSELRRRGFRQPIIALTAHALSEDREKCLRAGCTDYLTKPIAKDQLLQTINGHLAESAGALPRSAAATPARSVLRSEFAEDPDLKDILVDFVRRLPEQVLRLTTLTENGSLDELRRAVHQLKGAGGGYGFPRITEVAAAAEARIKSGQPMDSIASQVRELIELIRSVENYGYSPENPHAAENTGH
jgi:CheY-like chemotaxis protein/HPt (histidine-containing phosphotransfer) domain-containing protein